MTDVKIIPIFDQSAPGVWSDFAYIHAETMRTNYNYIMDPIDIQDGIDADVRHWRRGTNFAFGAYANGAMVGFVQGTAHGRCATIQSLYVLRDFQKQKVGHSLLRNAEHASSVFANRVELIALTKAEPFYRAHGYNTQYGTNAYEKTGLSSPRCACFPVFRCNRALELKMRNLDSGFDAGLVNTNHLPVYAYFDEDSKVIGMSVDDKIVVDTRCGISKIVERSLQYNLAKTR